MSSSVLDPGSRLGKYEVVKHVASGGMGTVYKAKDLVLGRAVALKVLPRNLADNGRLLERFRSEARNAALLSHPNIVTLFECGHDTQRDLHYLVMEFIDGVTLEEHINRKGRLSPEETRRILIQATKALHHAFENGVVHRDIKPSNFLLARMDKKVIVKLTDLGLALGIGDDDYRVTREGNTVGTVDYLSPEQARDSRSADVRSDIYSLGCTAYHMLTGRPPFADGGIGERIYKHMEVPPADVRRFNKAVSASFWGVILKMLAKKPIDRYRTPAELLVDLKSVPAKASDEDEESTVLEPGSSRKTVYGNDTPAQAQEPPASSDASQHDRVKTGADLPQKARRPSHEIPVAPRPSAPAEATAPTAAVVSPDQKRAAAAFHEKALQVIDDGGSDDYARKLLISCLELDPFHPPYLRTLRELNSKAAAGWFGSLNVLAIKSKMRLARTAGSWRKVLALGEDVLALRPADVDAPLDMVEAALALGQLDLALWYLQQARLMAPANIDLMRSLAQVHEKRKEWKAAVALWQQIAHLDPQDRNAARKINDLSAQAHISKGHYQSPESDKR